MIITNYISKNIPHLNENDTIKKVIQLEADFRLTHLPVVRKGKLVGNLNLEISRSLNEEEIIKDHLVELEQFYLYEKALIFDSLRVFSDNETNILPVIDVKGKFLGSVLEEDVVEEFADSPFIKEYGVYMTVTTPIKKYSISEIANIVESNNGRILGLMLVNTDEETAQITLKINAENISSIGDTFERFGYQISNKYFEDSKQELLKDRFDQFQRFMEV